MHKTMSDRSTCLHAHVHRTRSSLTKNYDAVTVLLQFGRNALTHYAGTDDTGTLAMVKYLLRLYGSVEARDGVLTLPRRFVCDALSMIVRARLFCVPQCHRTALMEASYRDQLRIVEHLMNEGAEVNATDKVSVKPRDNVRRWPRLTDCVVFADGLRYQHGFTPLAFAAMGGSVRVVAYLVGQGARIDALVTPPLMTLKVGHLADVLVMRLRRTPPGTRPSSGQ
jgi:hypothetical protein